MSLGHEAPRPLPQHCGQVPVHVRVAFATGAERSSAIAAGRGMLARGGLLARTESRNGQARVRGLATLDKAMALCRPLAAAKSLQAASGLPVKVSERGTPTTTQ